MATLGLTEDSVKQMIQASDMSLSLGLYQFTVGEQAVSVDGKVKSIDELKDLLIPITPSATNPSPFVRLGDIATIEVKVKYNLYHVQTAKMRLRFKSLKPKMPIR